MIDTDRVQAYRLKRRWTRQQLATAAGLCTNTVHALERGDSPGSAHTLARLAAALGVEPADLLKRRHAVKASGTGT